MRKHLTSAIVVASLALAGCSQMAVAAERTVHAPAAQVTAKETGGKKIAIFAGGCFWGVEAVFSHVKGVSSAISGYHGGAAKDAKYDVVSGGRTGHAEAVRVVYDPKVVRYDELLRIFFSIPTDPTQLNRQGPDSGTQYRSALVPVNAQQRKVARAYLAQLDAANTWGGPTVTKVESYKGFYKAEAYHQDFALNNPSHPYIRRWDAPMIAALKATFPAEWRASFQPG